MMLFTKKRNNFVEWDSYKSRIEFLSEFYYEQAKLRSV